MVQKRIFFALAMGALTGAFVVAAFFLYLAQPRLRQISPLLDNLTLAIFVALAGFTLARMTVTALGAYRGRRLWTIGRPGLLLPALLPLAILLGRSLGIGPDRVRASFIKVHNALVASGQARPKRLLIVVPHCLQPLKCNRRITVDVSRCVECGLCPITGLKELARMYGAELRVATGGGMARRIVEEIRPDAIVAVACERDLAEGIEDVALLPVIGVLNSRPHGPCLDTEVPLAQVRRALERLGARPLPNAAPLGQTDNVA